VKLVVGLGNPGPRYAGSPHNVGFCVVDHFAERHFGAGRAAWAQRFDAELALGALDTEQLVLLKPLTYMNRSGESVRKAMSFFKISVQSTLVVHDELDLPLGSVKLKLGGGEAGHNGLKSMSAELGTRDYARLRVGVGRPEAGEVSEFLLSPLPHPAASELTASFEDAGAAIELWVRHGIEQAMNRVNRKAPAVASGAASKAAPKAGQPD
jgi:PTH1 family peptidyl-tRNA hydrolase